jgi:coenzyme Q-binding protein COQ10
MNYFSDSRILNYTARQLFDLVMDIEQYPTFVPWCKACKLISKSDDGIIADLTANMGIFEKTYTSLITNSAKDDTYQIDITHVKGPFKKLDTRWKFIKHNKFSTKVDFSIDFEVSSDIANKIISSMFKSAAKDIIQAFENRAMEVYDERK